MVNEIFNSLEEEEVVEQDAPAENQEPSPEDNSESIIIAAEAALASNEIEEISETAISQPDILTYSSQKKRLIICCDGSWEDSLGARLSHKEYHDCYNLFDPRHCHCVINK